MYRDLTILQGALLAMQFVALYRMVPRSRGWPMMVGGFAGLVAINGIYLWRCALAGMSPPAVIQLGCCVLLLPLMALIVVLARDDGWRALFLALDYVTYLTAILPICHALLFQRLSGLEAWGGLIGSILFLLLAHVVFLFVLLPLVPPSNSGLPWRIGCIVAFVLSVLLYATGVWPHSLITGGWQEWTAFLLSSAVAWMVFPVMYAGLRSYLRNQGVVQNLALLAGEVAMRRAAIDAARRQRHDLRHHRIALAEYLLRGQVAQALRYLEQLDEESNRTPTDKLIWCENDTLNAILSGCARQAAAKGVGFEVEANVGARVHLPDVDVVAVVANLIENAINAAGAMAASGGKVGVALRQRERTVGMTVTNPVPAGFALSARGLPCEAPGVGIESVLRVVERHGGELVYVIGDGVLECQAMLRLRGR